MKRQQETEDFQIMQNMLSPIFMNEDGGNGHQRLLSELNIDHNNV